MPAVPADPAHRQPVSSDLAELAAIHGVVTSYEDNWGRHIPACESGVRAVLAALGVFAQDEEAVHASLAAAAEAPWRCLVVPTVVMRHGEVPQVRLHVPVPLQPRASILLEDGQERGVDAPRRTTQTRSVDGRDVARWVLPLPADLPPGDHRLTVCAGEASADAAIIVAPVRCRLPERRAWGWMLQLYATRSADSWGIGDLADLAMLAGWSRQAGADFLLVNPLHAATPGLPQQPSPYFPSSRCFLNPLYLRVEDIPELAMLPSSDAERVAQLAASCRSLNALDSVERDAIYKAKIEALELLHAVGLPPRRRSDFEAYRAERKGALADFAMFCALAERYGPSWRTWPAPLRRPDSPSVDAARQELGDRIAFHSWIQWLADTQLATAQRAARAAGISAKEFETLEGTQGTPSMTIGIITDLAVGIDPDGADAWAQQDDLGSGVTIGAPPDDFNVYGQDWRLLPLLPNRLSAGGYAPFREVVRASLRHAGGIRVDHILGLFRMWWIPEGAPPSAGTYVQYPVHDLLGVLALEAERAGAVVIGEDLGTAAPGAREALSERGMLSSRVVWFERTGPDWRRARSKDYLELALTSVTTHDLPTAAGFWNGKDLHAQAELEALLHDEGLVDGMPTLTELVFALQEFAARTPSWLVGIALGDAIADPRQPNVPGTIDEYPNWRLPLHDPATNAPLLLETLLDDPRVERLVLALRRARDEKPFSLQS